MADRNDELIALANQRATQQAFEQIQRDYQSNAKCYADAIGEGRTEDAAWALRNARNLEIEAAQILQTAQAQQPPQRPAQPQLTPKQQQILDSYPGVRSDPKKWAEAQYWDASLRMQGFDPNSDAYASRMLLGLGIQGSDGAEGVEIASPDTVVEAIRNSKYAGDFTREQYDHLAQYRDALKAHGFYKMDENK
jgi:hypothetical protein